MYFARIVREWFPSKAINSQNCEAKAVLGCMLEKWEIRQYRNISREKCKQHIQNMQSLPWKSVNAENYLPTFFFPVNDLLKKKKKKKETSFGTAKLCNFSKRSQKTKRDTNETNPLLSKDSFFSPFLTEIVNPVFYFSLRYHSCTANNICLDITQTLSASY